MDGWMDGRAGVDQPTKSTPICKRPDHEEEEEEAIFWTSNIRTDRWRRNKVHPGVPFGFRTERVLTLVHNGV